jgi:hypothetical protein
VESVTPGPGGLITTEQAAALCTRVRLPVAGRFKRRLLLDPIEVAKAEHATAPRARRMIRPTAA